MAIHARARAVVHCCHLDNTFLILSSLPVIQSLVQYLDINTLGLSVNMVSIQSTVTLEYTVVLYVCFKITYKLSYLLAFLFKLTRFKPDGQCGKSLVRILTLLVEFYQLSFTFYTTVSPLIHRSG